MAEIIFDNISKTYDPGLFKKKIQAVNGLSIEVRSGEVFGLIGPNGAGKSTAIRLLLGLIRPDNGSITFRGDPLSQVTIQRHIGYLPENPYLYDHLNLDEVLRFSGRASGMAQHAIAVRSDELVKRLNLTEARRRPLRTYSKGMLQRAGICFALLHDPAVLILDEPMSGLDPVGRKMVFDLIHELKEQGKTVFFCSHILSDVERLCDSIVLMMGGRLVRRFAKAEFAPSGRHQVHLLVANIPAAQQQILETAGVDISPEGDNLVLSVPVEQFASVAGQMSASGVEILASRNSRFSLESCFMQTYQEHNS